MRPDKTKECYSLSFFETPLEEFIDPNHELVKLSRKIDWEFLEEHFSKYYKEEGRKGNNIRLMLGLQILSYVKNLSDEAVCNNWRENPYYQYFCGEKLFKHRLPINRSSISRFRSRIKVEELEKILQESLSVAHKAGALKIEDVKKIAVDTTVQNKAVDSPSETKLLLDAILDLGRSAKKAGLKLKQNYRFVATSLARKASGYAHARQFNRLKTTNKKLGSVDIRLDLWFLSLFACKKNKFFEIDKLLLHNLINFSAKNNRAKGGHFILSCNALHGKPYDGHTLKATVDKVINNTGAKPKRIYVDKGYRGHDYKDELHVFKSGQRRGVTASIKKELKRRSAIEPIIGHAKMTHKLDKCRLKGVKGDQINAIFSAIGFNFRQILNWFKKICLLFLQILFLQKILPLGT